MDAIRPFTAEEMDDLLKESGELYVTEKHVPVRVYTLNFFSKSTGMVRLTYRMAPHMPVMEAIISLQDLAQKFNFIDYTSCGVKTKVSHAN